jgi:hypothetical protein
MSTRDFLIAPWDRSKPANHQHCQSSGEYQLSETDGISSSNGSMSEIVTHPTADQINEHTPSTFINANDTITLLFWKPVTGTSFTNMPVLFSVTTTPKPPEQTKLSKRHGYWLVWS